jgi:hypothetical protein
MALCMAWIAGEWEHAAGCTHVINQDVRLLMLDMRLHLDNHLVLAEGVSLHLCRG